MSSVSVNASKGFQNPRLLKCITNENNFKALSNKNDRVKSTKQQKLVWRCIWHTHTHTYMPMAKPLVRELGF